MVTETPVTREQLEAEAVTKANEVKTADKAHANAMKAFSDATGKVSMEELLDLGRKVDKAKSDAEYTAKLAKKAQERVDGFEMELKRDERNALISGDVASIRDGLINWDHYAAVGVEKITFTVDISERTVSPKPSGPGIRTATAGPRKSSNGGNGGFQSRGAIQTVDGAQYKSVNRAYMELRAAADGVEESDITPANTESASRWLRKHFDTDEPFVYINQG